MQGWEAMDYLFFHEYEAVVGGHVTLGELAYHVHTMAVGFHDGTGVPCRELGLSSVLVEWASCVDVVCQLLAADQASLDDAIVDADCWSRQVGDGVHMYLRFVGSVQLNAE